jgi:hypothetical protein
MRIGRNLSTSLPYLGRIAAFLLLTSPVHAQVNVLTNRYDGARTGANLSETTLTVANVNPSQFGKLYSYPVDGSVYAQPLYASGVVINGTPRNVLYVATMHDKVYAFDADSSSPSPLWMRDFTNPPSITPVPISDIVPPNMNIVGNVGIQSTPVIDAASRTIYLLARTKESGSYFQRLHALDIATGASRPGSPVTIAGSVAGFAPDGSGQVVTFNPKMQSQRAGLAISNGVVLISWAGHEDRTPYHGWVMGYDTASLARVGIYCVTPDVYGGGIWQGGRAPAIDASGNVYFATGNGRYDGNRSFGNSLLKLGVSRTGGFSLLDYFTPANHAQLDADDDDLSGSGFTLLPGTNLLLGGGKEGVLYLLNADNLGRMAANDAQIVQKIPVTGGHVMGGAVYWNSANLGPMVYNWSEDDALKSYRFSGGRLALPAHSQGLVISPGHPGGSLTLSANGNASSSGIVWSSMPATEDAIHGLKAGVLRAFNAETLAEIWSSERNASRDRAGTLMKFLPPVVVNGRVFLPNHDNAVAVYGLLPQAPQPPGGAGTISVNFTGSHPAQMAAGETAGVVAAANWTNATGSSGSAALMNASGASTGATLSWSAPSGTYLLPITDQPGNARMMKGYLDTSSTSSTTVSVAGLPQATYDVYVYADGDNKVYERSAAYTISGPGISTTTINLTDAANTNFGTFTRADNSAGNYVRFSIAATGFTVTATPTEPVSGTRRAPINGIQIVPTTAEPPPPPPDFGLHTHPHSRTVARGATTTYDVTATAWNGFSGTIALSVSGAPAGTTTTFNPASIGGSGSSTLTVTTSTSTPAATSTLTITGRSGTLSHSESVALTVEAAPPPPPAGAGTISIDFVGNNPASMAASETAGAVARANWNSAFGASSGAPLPLKDETGAPTNAALSWSAPGGTYMTPIADQPGSARMMKGYLDTTSTSRTTVWITGLAAGTYDVYVYADGDNKVYDRAAAYTISGSGISATTINLTDGANANFGSTFTRADNSNGNYVRFSINLAAAGGFTLEAVPTTPEIGTRRAPVNGIQIVPTSAPPPPPAGAIGVDFLGGSTVAMTAAETAGVVPKANWNSASGASRTTPLALVDETGAPTNATLTWSANGGWRIPVTDRPGDTRMMAGYLDTNSTSITTLTVAGLPSRAYDVYVYVDGDNREYTRTAAYRISGPGITDTSVTLTDPANTNFSGTFTPAAGTSGNYVKFTITAGGFTLTATPVSGTNPTLRAPINAIQIVPR